MGTKWIRGFIVSAGGILLAAALIRFLIAVGNAQCLSLPEPLLGIPLRYAVLLVGTIELTVALICLFGRQVVPQIGWLAWLATNFIIYRIGLFSMHCHLQATCIGSLTDPLQLARGTTGLVIEFIPVYLLLGSYAVVARLWFGRGEMGRAALPRGQATSAESLKMSCALCNGHIVFSAINLGQKIPCPHCKATITLMMPKNIKTSCPSCGEHIEFPLHGLGQTIACPHCTVPVTLQLPV
jgi:DNA-directed RNA polymerase subunit RPC12/RpoP